MRLQQYYVYHLIDPRNDTIFYVGKGKNNRIHMHEIEARKGTHSRKCALIREIEFAGFSIVKSIVKYFDDEKEAYDHEAVMIDLIGLTNLTNVVRGGCWVARVRDAKLEISKRELLKKHATRAWLTKWYFMVERWPGVTFPGMKNGDEVAEQFVATVRELLFRCNEVENAEDNC